MSRTAADPAAAPFCPGLCDRLAARVEALGRLFRHTPEAVLDYFWPRLGWHNGRPAVAGVLTPGEAVLLRVNGPDLVRILAEGVW